MPDRVRLVGINHVALSVGDIEEALAFYGALFEIRLRGRERGMAFVDMGDQFIALAEGRTQEPDDGRHFGLVVDDKDAARAALAAAGVPVSGGRRLDFRDPWGNHVQVVDYRDIQFSKTPEVLAGMELPELTKHDGALRELRNRFSPARHLAPQAPLDAFGDDTAR
jgi:catechol 2,3-dioxygenase-like lactoylglutathione lyase family enzyme